MGVVVLAGLTLVVLAIEMIRLVEHYMAHGAN